MGTIHLVTTERDYDLTTSSGETILEALRKNNLPIQGMLLLRQDRSFVSMAHALGPTEEIWAHSLRNPDFGCLLPDYEVIETPNAVTEFIRPCTSPKRLSIVKLDRSQAMNCIYTSFKDVLLSYLPQDRASWPEIQIALSAGGDGRVVAECARDFLNEFPAAKFHCIIMAIGTEDESEHITNATRIADTFQLKYSSFGVRDVAAKLSLRDDLNKIAEQFRYRFPQDEPEILGTYWVQELNLLLAKEAGRRAIIFGYNQEDVIAERLYQLLTGHLLPPYPVRRLAGADLIAPLTFIPKKVLDSMDVANSLRNYGVRVPSVSYLRSSLYFIAYLICERFPAIADAVATGSQQPELPDSIADWIKDSRCV